jgi:hypothetical protein
LRARASPLSSTASGSWSGPSSPGASQQTQVSCTFRKFKLRHVVYQVISATWSLCQLHHVVYLASAPRGITVSCASWSLCQLHHMVPLSAAPHGPSISRATSVPLSAPRDPSVSCATRSVYQQCHVGTSVSSATVVPLSAAPRDSSVSCAT